MSKLILVWAADKATALARASQLVEGESGVRVLRRDVFDVVLAEDIDRGRSTTSRDQAFAVVVQVDA
jgi:hypothetical protein